MFPFQKWKMCRLCRNFSSPLKWMSCEETALFFFFKVSSQKWKLGWFWDKQNRLEFYTCHNWTAPISLLLQPTVIKKLWKNELFLLIRLSSLKFWFLFSYNNWSFVTFSSGKNAFHWREQKQKGNKKHNSGIYFAF